LPAIVGSVVKVLFGIVLWVGLPLLGWGLKDITGFIRNPVRLVYVLARGMPSASQGSSHSHLFSKSRRSSYTGEDRDPGHGR